MTWGPITQRAPVTGTETLFSLVLEEWGDLKLNEMNPPRI